MDKHENKVIVQIVRDDRKEFNIGEQWRILSLEGFGSYENDINITEKAVGDGGIISSARIANKDRTIVAKCTNQHLNEVLRKEANSFFNAKHIYKVYITYMGVTRWAEGMVYKYAISEWNIHRGMELSVTFLFPDPYLRSLEAFGQDIADTTPMAAFPFLCGISDHAPVGVTGGIFNFARMVFLENDGDVDAYCKAVFVAEGRVKNPTLLLDDKYVRILDTLEAGDVLELDFTKAPPTVKKNGINWIGKCDRTSSFNEMVIRVGEVQVRYDADEGTNLVQVSIYYNKLYAVI